MRENYGKSLPGLEPSELSGKLIVIEGTDGAGRTTQINLLKPWLEELGHAVLYTGMARSSLAGEGIRRAKEGNNLGRVTQSLFYATDFVDRFENEIVPALRAGFIVLTDRYIYSLMARAIVRGVDPWWVRKLYRMALKPDAVFYLRVGLEQLIPRVIFSRGFDYWESGMDFSPASDLYEGFCSYQTAMLAEFDRLGAEYNFQSVDAAADAKAVFGGLKARILRLLRTPLAAPPVLYEFASQRQSNELQKVDCEPHGAGLEFRDDLKSLLAQAALAQAAAAESSRVAPLPPRMPEAQPRHQAPVELNLSPIAAQIDEAFALALQSLQAGSQFGKSAVKSDTKSSGYTTGNGHSNGHNDSHHT